MANANGTARTTELYTTGAIGELLLRVEGEYRETPGLSLTVPQAERLWGLDASTCASVLTALIERRVLTRTASGAYLRRSAGPYRWWAPVDAAARRQSGAQPWKSLKVDIVFECTGAFTRREDLDAHIRAGARYVILSTPSKSDDVETIVHGVNTPQGGTAIISCASCTTNCITPVMEILGRRIGVKKAIMTTVHAYTASQAIVDSPHTRARRGRAGAANLVPTSTGAAAATAKALPEYRGRFDGVAVRAPVAVGSLADIVALVTKPTTVDEVNQVFTQEAGTERYRGVLGVTTDPVVSSDIIKDSRASVVDLGMTQVVDGDLVKVMSWYDNEWGYSNQLVREALRIVTKTDRKVR